MKEGISLTWVAGAGNATSATFTIKDGTDTFTSTVDQKNTPHDNTGDFVCSQQHALSASHPRGHFHDRRDHRHFGCEHGQWHRLRRRDRSLRR